MRHPDVARVLHLDFQIMTILARWAARLPTLRNVRFEDSIQMFGVPLHQQLDLSMEAAHLDRFRHNFRCASAHFEMHKQCPDLSTVPACCKPYLCVHSCM